jgi:hypothetical protein
VVNGGIGVEPEGERPIRPETNPSDLRNNNAHRTVSVRFLRCFVSGRYWTRTSDPRRVKAVLYQLSQSPEGLTP